MSLDPDALPERPYLIVNPKSGGGKAETAGLAEEATTRGIEVHVLGPGEDLQDLARRAVAEGADALGMAGGDGSLGLVADVAMQHDVSFVCIPAGTRNHLARDIGLDRNDLIGALDAFRGERRRIDAARVNDRVFLNNVTLGVYAEVVHEPGYRDNKLGTTTEVIPELLKGARPPTEMQFSSPDGREWDSAFVVLVSNNPYDLASFVEFGVRSRLDQGCLAVTVVDATAATEFAEVAASVLLGRLERSSSFHHWVCHSFTIESPADQMSVGLDGEALSFPPPLRFEILPRALELLVPPGTTGPRGQRRPVFGRRTLTDLLDVARGRA